MDEFHVALKVAVDHEHLVAAGVGARPLPDLLVVLLYVLLHAVSPSVHGRAALVRALVDGGQLLPLRAQLLLPAWLGPRFLSNFWFFRLLGFFALTLLTRDLLFRVRLKGLVGGLRALLLVILVFTQEVSDHPRLKMEPASHPTALQPHLGEGLAEVGGPVQAPQGCHLTEAGLCP